MTRYFESLSSTLPSCVTFTPDGHSTRALRVFEMSVPKALSMLTSAGLFPASDFGAAPLDLRNAINEGKISGPRMQVATYFIGSTGSHGDLNGFTPWLSWQFPTEMSGIADGPDAVRQKVRYLIKYGADVIKFGASAGVLTEETSVGAPQFTQEEMNAIVDEAKFHGLKACAHAHGTEAIKMAIRAGVDSVEHCSFIDDEGLKLAKQHGTYLVFDIYNDDFILAEYGKLGVPPEQIAKEYAQFALRLLGYNAMRQPRSWQCCGTSRGSARRSSAARLGACSRICRSPRDI